MDLIVNLYFNNSELNDDVKTLILSWVSFFRNNWNYMFNIDKEVILKLEFFLDNKKVISKNAPPNNEVYMHELKKNPEVVLKFMKVSMHLLLFKFLGLDKKTEHLETFDEKDKKDKNNNNNKECNFIRKEEIKDAESDNLLINELRYDKYKDSEIFKTFFFTNRITIYLYNWNKVDKFENLKSEKVNQLICIRGSVLRVSPIQLLITNLNFLCEKCKQIIKIEFTDGKYETPKRCINSCDGKNFIPIRESAKSIEYQKLILKENRKNLNNIYETNDSNIKNLTVTLEVSKFFVNSCIPGNYVEALGILKVISFNNNYLINGKNSLFNMYIDCLSIFPLSSKKYLNNSYFNIVKIKETKNKIHSSLLWESYIDKFNKKMLYLKNKRSNKTENKEEIKKYRYNVNKKNMNKMESSPDLPSVDNVFNSNKSNSLSYKSRLINSSDKFEENLLHKSDYIESKSSFYNNEKIIEENLPKKQEKEKKEKGSNALLDDEIFNVDNNMYDDDICMYGEYISEEKFSNRNSNINNSDIENENFQINDTNNDSFNLNKEFDEKTLEFINDMHKNENNKFYLLIASFCPRIIMSNYIKAGLLLSLLGGKTIYDEYNQIKRRGNIHNLLIGDPGLGKSRILQYISNIIDKSLFICSTSTSINGLTACAVKDTSNNEYSLEGGALVLSDKGVCCIDELDKISLNDQQSFLECMESQSINITKAGIVCNLKTRCTIIAASNPKEGKYNYKRTIFDNIKIPFPLLSRFDLVFLLADRVSEEKDHRISNYLINTSYRNKNSDEEEDNNIDNDSLIFSMKDSLHHKCKQINEQNYLPLELIGVFIKYSRKYIFPTLSIEAKKYIRKFYLHLRNLSITHNDISIPITIRQLESLIRLCQARARADLSNTVTLNHAKEVVEIYQKTIFYPLHIKTLNFKEKSTKTSKGKSAASLSNVFKENIIQLAKQKNNKIYNKELHNLAKSIILSADSNISDETLIHFGNPLICLFLNIFNFFFFFPFYSYF
ncbi:minichromosome maintenance protein, putative [Plasmodium relictum]|uniref:DNA helicase n=1 Tax=Plasmodium relictum TaxID=85471 RepID=A0A1J1HH05_PLARL|nr:minichromosome maintenance protein, putative [Plasmodium relictum]CRH03761.1 minichromosome maintenance protein, putative [Plasmodium relictum]